MGGGSYSPYSTPCPREFDCRRCGTHVLVTSRDDHRTIYCCAYCEREFWRHRDRYDRKKNIARGHVTDEARDARMLEWVD